MSQMAHVRFKRGELSDWSAFYEASARRFGFHPTFGRNKEAWIECMEELDTRSDPLVRKGAFVLIEYVGRYTDRNVDRDVEAFLIAGAARINGTRLADGELPYLICAERGAA